MNVIIRADGNREIAMGHMMRCLSIADAAAKLGESTTFILADGQAVDFSYAVSNDSIFGSNCIAS